MSSTVIPLRPSNDPDTVLECSKGRVKSVLVLGWDNDGKTFCGRI